MTSYNFRDADDATSDLDGKDMQGGRVRVELARDPRDSRRDRGGGGFGRGGRDGRRGNPPGPKTNYRLVVENISSRTSWQVNISKYILHIAYITLLISPYTTSFQYLLFSGFERLLSYCRRNHLHQCS